MKKRGKRMKFLALALLSLVSAEVVNLTGDNFAESIADGNNWFIKYYSRFFCWNWITYWY